MNSLVFPAGLSAHKNYGDCSYIHSVLQCFLMHPLMKEINNSFNFNQLNNNKRFRLTIEMLRLFNTINQGNIGNSTYIIDLHDKISDENRNILGNDNRYLLKDPYHFLYYFLHFLHIELNFSQGNFDINVLTNASLRDKKQENLILEIFANYLLAYHGNSLIFRYFLSSEKNKYLCNNCGTYFDFSINSIFTMYLPQIKEYYYRKNRHNAQIVTLDDCFDCYCNDNNVFCQYCNSNIKQYKQIYNGKSLIIRFRRNSLGNSCDVSVPYTFDFTRYSGLTDNDFNNRFYVLKSCISFMPFNNNSGKYLADVNIDVNSNSGKWIRYMDSQVKVLDNPDDIKRYEPQILIYELKILEPNNNFGNQNMNNNHNFDPNRIIIQSNYNNNNNINNQMNMDFIQGNFGSNNNLIHQNNNNMNPMNNMNNMNPMNNMINMNPMNNNQIFHNMNFNLNPNQMGERNFNNINEFGNCI